jgi:DMSO reductase anchor subunit
MVYRATGRVYWNGPSTTTRFFLSAAVQGLALTLLISVAGDLPIGVPTRVVSMRVALALAAVACVKLIQEASVLAHLRDRRQADLRRTATLLVGELREWSVLRAAAAVMGGILLPLAIRSDLGSNRDGNTALVFSILAFVLVLFGELAERALFFMSVSAPRMPGGVGR